MYNVSYLIPFHMYYFSPNKWYIGLEVQFERGNPDGSTRMTTAHMRSTPAIMLNGNEIQQQIEGGINRIDALVDTFANVGSGWTINQIGNVTLHIADYDNIGGSSYIASPAWLSKKKATLNIRNNDERCFLYCILAAAHYVGFKDHADRVTKYAPYLHELNVEGLTFPIEIGQIPIFETNNTDFSVNVVCIDSDEDKTFVPLY